MAIQITEKHLSPEAKKALDNAVNKSQFLRDAIEFYVRRGQVSECENVGENTTLREELKEIKSILAQLTSNCTLIDKKSSDNISNSSNEISSKEINVSETTCVDKSDSNEEINKPINEIISKVNKSIKSSSIPNEEEEDDVIPECYK